MIKRTEQYFHYPPNLHQFDLATLVSLYRSRGEPVRAPAGELYGCPITYRLVKEAKRWFGITYSQQAWDQLLTKGSHGYPLTDVELNVLGLATHIEGLPHSRDFIEKNSGAPSQLVFMILNDLKTFGLLEEDESGAVRITALGEDALHGISRRIYDKKFFPEMLHIVQKRLENPTIEVAPKKDGPQIDMF
jgi:hypothetical protein